MDCTIKYKNQQCTLTGLTGNETVQQAVELAVSRGWLNVDVEKVNAREEYPGRFGRKKYLKKDSLIPRRSPIVLEDAKTNGKK